MLEFVFCRKIQKINLNHYYKIYSKFVDRFLLQIRGLFCGQTCWSCWQNLWTDFSDKFWADFVDKFVHICLTNFRDRFYRQNTNLDIDIFVDRICRQICTALTNIFSTHLLKRISKIFFSARGRNLFFVWDKLCSFLTNLLKRIS